MSRVNLTDVIGPSFYDFHQQLKDPATQEAWVKGGRGSLKSSTISVEILLGMYADKNANAICLRRYENEIRGSVWTQLKLSAGRLGTRHLWKFTASPFEATYIPTGQKILFFGADDPTKIKSTAIENGYFKYMWCEEVDQFGGLEELRNIEQTIFRGTNEHQIGFYSYNPPKSSRSWVNQEVKRSAPGRIVHHSDYRTAPREWLGERFIAKAEALKETNEPAYRHEYLGEEIGTGLEVFLNVTTRRIDSNELPSEIYQGLDFGYMADPLAFERVAFDAKRRRLFIFGEIYGLRIANRVFAERLKTEWRDVEILADSAEPKSIIELKDDWGVKVRGAEKGPGSVEAGIKWMADLAEIVIDPDECPLAAKEFVNYSLNVARDGTIIERYPDKDNHSIDAVRYALSEIVRERKRYYVGRA